MRSLLALTALEVEARILARQLRLAPVAEKGWSRWEGRGIDVVPVGLGAARLRERASRRAGVGLVVSAGACGALAPDLSVGDLVAPEAVLGPSGLRYLTDAVPGLARRGTLVTAPGVVDTPAAKARLWSETGALAVDMESAAVVAWARAEGLPVAVVRGVSDSASQAVSPDLVALAEPDGRVRAGRALRLALGRPRALAGAVALRRGTTAALRTVAAALEGIVEA